MRANDLTGQRFGRLEVLQENGVNKYHHTAWICVCECGEILFRVDRGALITGNTKSCGCLDRDKRMERNFKHGYAYRGKATRINRIYHGIRTRCNNPKATNYALYGGKGIKCLWNNFEHFLYDMGDSYEQKQNENPDIPISIERIDSNGNYCKENCRWATPIEQANNISRNHQLTFNGKTLSLAQWGRIVGLQSTTIRQRLNLGYTVEQALTLKVGQLRS